jgi:flagellar FliL protein
MAETKDDIEINEDSGKSKNMLVIIAVSVMLISGGTAAFFLLSGEEATPEQLEVKQVKQAAIYHSVEKPFVVNFKKQSNSKVSYMQIKLKVMARDQGVIDGFKLHLPAIQHELLMLFFSQNYDAMNTKEGTKILRQEALTLINDLLKTEGQENGLKSVYFTSLIMQ